MTLYRLLADLVLIIHAIYIAFVVGGLLAIWVGYFLGWKWTRGMIFRIAHLLAIGLVVLQAYVGIVCPLTVLESNLRERAGQEAYSSNGFIADWLHRSIFFSAPPGVFLLIYTLFGLAVVGTLVLSPPMRAARRDPEKT